MSGFAARHPALPALGVVELSWCCCGNSDCPVVGCTHAKSVELLAELRAAWPGLDLRRFEKDEWTQA